MRPSNVVDMSGRPSPYNDLAQPIAEHTCAAIQCGLTPNSTEKPTMTTASSDNACEIFKKKSDYGTLHPRRPRWERSPQPHRRLAMTAASALTLGCIWLLVTSSLYAQRIADDSSRFKLQESWAQYSPYFAAAPYIQPPKSCRIIQANTIQRHGARYPTAKAAKAIVTALTKLQSVSHDITDAELAFLKDYTFDLGADDLVASGAQESQESGHQHFSRYGHLVSRKKLPFVRASGSERVVLSATNWTEGFSIASHHRYNPTLSVILSEELNDTLDDAMCPNSGSSDVQTNQWLLQYGTPIADDLNSKAPGANLTTSDIYSLISLCPFETVAKGSSPFCALFTQADFESFEYSGDLDKFYNTGYGQELGPVQGVGYINELIARLTGKSVVDHTQTNRTLDSSPETFPLDRSLYIDFSHDNQMIAIYAALGLFRQHQPLDPTQPDSKRNWLASHLVPFGARMTTEKLLCGRKEYVRILVNDALQPLEFCGIGDGLCELGAFVRSQSYARNDGEGDFEKCFS